MRSPLRTLRILWAIVLVALPTELTTAPSWAEDDSCEMPERPAYAAAGHWTGIFQGTTETEMRVLSFYNSSTIKYAGDLEFDLVRDEAPPQLRRQLVPPENAREARCSVGPADSAKMCGIVHLTFTSSSTGMSYGTSTSMNSGTNEPMEVEIEGQEALLTGRLEEVNLLTSGKLSLRGRGTLVYPDGTQGSTSVDTSKMHPYDVLFPKREKIFPLQVNETSCGVITGEIDAVKLKALAEQRMNESGLRTNVNVKESNSVATLDERDVEFEKAVHVLASEPIPADLTWAYIEAFHKAYDKLRAGAGTLTDYKLCVLKALDRKIFQIHVAALRILLDNFPTVAEGSTLAVFQAAAVRVLEIRKKFAMVGMEDCPLALKAEKVILQRMDEIRNKGS